MRKDWLVQRIVNECHDLKQGIFYCPWCDSTVKTKDYDVLTKPWPEHCEKKMNLLQNLSSKPKVNKRKINGYPLYYTAPTLKGKKVQ